MSLGIAAYSFPCACGLARREGACHTPPLDAWGLIDLAQRHGLHSVELPLHGYLPNLDVSTIDRLQARLEETGIGLVVDTPQIDLAMLQALLPLAARAGASTVRVLVSTVLEGARASVPGGWDAHLAWAEGQLREVYPLLDELGLMLALENHQDVTSAELLRLCAVGPRIGVTLDVANPLAVGEGVLEFARAVGPHIRNVHLKDYTIHATGSGYRLVRAAVGEGDLPWAELLPLLAELAPTATLQIELAALYGRHIRIFEQSWWQGFPPTDVRAALPALHFMASHARPAATAWQTPWELGAPFAEVAGWELAQFERSVAFLRAFYPGK
ncbi:MAG: sugar phosphate isomerase/epimerase [Roseiflexaceae bacterium]|nr:sugar phosphate isomerase/epimerase [Roseiflexaceae bacterium]